MLVSNEHMMLNYILSLSWQPWSRGHFKNTYELLNVWALNFHMWIKSTSFNVWVKYFVCNFKGNLWNSTQNILPIHWKMWSLYNIKILRAFRFESSYAFMKCMYVNVWALKFSHVNKVYIFQCMGKKILCGISKVTFEIPHKISYPYIERCDLIQH